LCVGDGCENARKGGPSGSGKDLSIADISKSQWLKEFDDMGFFAQHGKYSEGSGKKFSVAEQGIYICALIDCEAVQGKSFDDPNVLEPNFKWVFETTEVGDDDGQPFRFIQYTKTYYGNEKAKLTILLDGMVGRMTNAQFAALDIEALNGKSWQVVVGTRQKMNGELTNVIETVKPVKVAATKPLKKAVIVTDDIVDPFGEE
jgi:hypothetical protein